VGGIGSADEILKHLLDREIVSRASAVDGNILVITDSEKAYFRVLDKNGEQFFVRSGGERFAREAGLYERVRDDERRRREVVRLHLAVDPRLEVPVAGENRGDERRFTHALVSAGADLVLASGPHVLRGLQLFGGSLIAYSLGNFAMCSQALSMEGVLGQSAILTVTLGSDGTLVSGRFLPVQLVGGVPRRTSDRSIVQRVNALSRADFGGSAVLVGSNHALGLG